ncbi:hypothetical protein BJX96DRAFT_151029 [Aspergillus floccosus]
MSISIPISAFFGIHFFWPPWAFFLCFWIPLYRLFRFFFFDIASPPPGSIHPFICFFIILDIRQISGVFGSDLLYYSR